MNRVAQDRFVDHYIETVLQVVEQLESEHAPDPQATHELFRQQLVEGRRLLGAGDLWEPVAFALSAWTDEMFLDLPWTGRTWWNDHVLEAELFGTRLCSERFFELARVAARDPSDGVLRVFHDCVLLGFRGLYSLPSHGQSTAKQLGLPATLEQWLAEVQDRLDDQSDGADPAKLHRRLAGAAPEDERRTIVWWSVAAATMFAINVTVYFLYVRQVFTAS